MKKIVLLLFSVTLFQLSFAQEKHAKQPALMVLPDDIYCIRKNFLFEFDDQGVKKMLPDYKTATQRDQDLRQVIGKINEIILGRGWEKIKYLEKEIAGIEERNSELNAISSKKGNSISVSPVDVLKQRAKADIIIGVDFELKTMGPKEYIHFNLQGYDAYTGLAVASVSGDGPLNYKGVATPGVLIETAVLTHIDNFLEQLSVHFDNLFLKGRECRFRIQVFENTDVDLESEFNVDGEQEELADIIDAWFQKNSVEGRYSRMDASETFMDFSARIPLFDDKGQPLDAKEHIKGLRKYLNKEPFNLTVKTYERGLGEAWLIIGEK